MSQAVIFLARGHGAGLDALRGFLDSYKNYPAGIAHDLIVLKKGWEGVPGSVEVEPLVARHGGRVLELPDDGFDWGAYMRAALLVDHDWLLFLNSHSLAQADDWVRHMRFAAEQIGIGAAGATGSWGTIRPVLRFFWPIVHKVAESKGLLKGAVAAGLSGARFPMNWALKAGRFPPFPNPHLRSNAFLIRRALFLKFVGQARLPRNKHEAFELESGFRGLTRWLASSELEVIVAGIGGGCFKTNDWANSETFRYPGHTNLLVSDNQTRAYDGADSNLKWIMEMSAWGHSWGETEINCLVSRGIRPEAL